MEFDIKLTISPLLFKCQGEKNPPKMKRICFPDLTFGGHFVPSIEEFSGEVTDGIAVARVSSLQMYSMGVTNV